MTYSCHGCQQPIKFDNAVKSESGKVIPLNPDGSRHDCPAKSQNNSAPAVQKPPTDMKQSLPSISLVELDKRCVDAAQEIISILNRITPYSKMSVAIAQEQGP